MIRDTRDFWGWGGDCDLVPRYTLRYLISYKKTLILLLLAFVFPPDRNTVGSRTLTTPRPHLTLIGLSTRWRAPLPSRLLVFTSCGPTFLPTPPPLLPSCLPISLFSITGVRILLLGSRSPIRHYYRHRAPLGVLVIFLKRTQLDFFAPNFGWLK